MMCRIAIIALGALCCLLSGCGCSKDKGTEVPSNVPSRMEDAAYTNQLATLHDSRKAVAMKAEAIRAKIAKLGKDARNSPEYAELTNQLANCEAESARIRRDTLTTIRARILKEGGAVKKGSLKK